MLGTKCSIFSLSICNEKGGTYSILSTVNVFNAFLYHSLFQEALHRGRADVRSDLTYSTQDRYSTCIEEQLESEAKSFLDVLIVLNHSVPKDPGFQSINKISVLFLFVFSGNLFGQCSDLDAPIKEPFGGDLQLENRVI